MDKAIHEEAAELVKKGSDCLQSLERQAGQSHVSEREKNTTAKVLASIENWSEKVWSREAERKQDLEAKIKRREAEIRQKVSFTSRPRR